MSFEECRYRCGDFEALIGYELQKNVESLSSEIWFKCSVVLVVVGLLSILLLAITQILMNSYMCLKGRDDFIYITPPLGVVLNILFLLAAWPVALPVAVVVYYLFRKVGT